MLRVKNKTEKFKTIDRLYNSDAQHSIFITDTLGDLREAKLAGVPTICVTWGAHDRSYFEREPHENLLKIVDTSQELLSNIYNYFKETL